MSRILTNCGKREDFVITTSGVHHITLIVRDVQKSRKFYTKVCGMRAIVDEKEYCGLTDGTFSLWLALSRGGSKKKFNEEDTGLNHWAFRVNSRKELREIEEELRKMGIEMEDSGITDDGYGGTAIFTRDPNGMKVEFHVGDFGNRALQGANPRTSKTRAPSPNRGFQAAVAHRVFDLQE